MDYSIVIKEDLVELADAFRKTFNSPPWNDEWTKETAKQRLLMQFSNPYGLGYKVKKEKEIIGFIFGYFTGLPTGKGFFIEDLCITHEHQRKGIGKIILAELERNLKDEKVELIITTTAKGLDSFNFYLKNGFKENPATIGMYKYI